MKHASSNQESAAAVGAEETDEAVEAAVVGRVVGRVVVGADQAVV